MHRDLFNAASTLRQQFGLHRAVDLMSDTLSADGSHIYGSIDEKAAVTDLSITQQSSPTADRKIPLYKVPRWAKRG
jgi:hypothetical protein